MVQSVPLNDPHMPGPDKSLFTLYEDKAIETMIYHIVEDNDPYLSEVVASKFYKGDIPDSLQKYVSSKYQEPESTANRKSSDSNATVDEFDGLSKKRRTLFKAIEDEWGFGDSAETWTVKDASEESGVPEDTVRSYVGDFKEKGWIIETGDKKNRSKVYKLLKSRHRQLLMGVSIGTIEIGGIRRFSISVLGTMLW